MLAIKLNSESIWQAAKRPTFKNVTKSAEYDAVVIGGGITGLTAAYLLKRAGKKVAVVERHRIGFVDTGLTTAHLTYVTDLRLPSMVKRFGEKAAQLVWQAGAHAIDTIEETAAHLQIDCDFHRCDGYLHESITAKQDETPSLREDASLASELGFEAEFAEHVPYFNRPGVKFANQAKFHPLKYIAGLAAAINGQGSHVFEEAEVTEIQNDPQAVMVDKHQLRAEYIVIATHVPLMGKTGILNATLFQAKLFPYSSYVIGAKIPRGVIPVASFWDTSEPYYYLRVEAGKATDYAIFGGKDHKTGQADSEQTFAELQKVLTTIIPEAQPDRQWSGQVIETSDGLPFIGETAERQFVATGFSGNGMTFSTLAALMARDAMLKKKNSWQDLFSVNRQSITGLWESLSENMDYPYYYAKDRLVPAEGSGTRDVKRGEGKILSLSGERVACSRDNDGKLCMVSAVCTHMGCLVRWNSAELTWDCPCHGSRFKPTGEVLAGPAETPLEKVKPAKKKRANAAQSEQTASEQTAKRKRASKPK
ncbi:Gamma-glutamylputrescine oxidoreductase [Anatilimnocola aggregata]|uniref:Gamma-glutamylputrescine oxidoreductase n=1 Tax=Anatilimnocola aggregata TaxID=2528021 RepID=A0A517Y4Y8_9BACT|nr:FAD-dependent oxidoreductase [Anatilimnocola aggregata]QDU25313.1 Gamma-glutamylputrescine oxidoreductase [Anatilimnocola aggregata]